MTLEPDWLKEPLRGLLNAPCIKTDLGDELAFTWTTNPSITLIFNQSRIPNAHDLDFVAAVVRDSSKYLASAADFLTQNLKSDTSGAVAICEPRLIFRLDNNWEVHFQDITANGTETFSVLVYFGGEYPKNIEILDFEAASWFDSDTGEWIPL